MKIMLIYIYLIINISFQLSLDNPANLPSDYPFSIKKDTNTAIIFSYNYISLFDVTKTTIPQNPLVSENSIDCPSGEEKGGAFLDDYYYTSCLNPTDNTKFQIKVYDSSFSSVIQTYPTEDDYFEFSSTIRFFKLNSVIEAAWLSNGLLNLAKFDNTGLKDHRTYPVTRGARDTDCVFISNFNRIVCAFGIRETEETETFSCSANIFTSEHMLTSNLKIWNVCNNHQSRKLKLDNDNTQKFYYYFVDTNNDAYILPLTMTSSSVINNGNVMKIMSGCDGSQTSFDLAEDKFNGYFVFTCVENRFKRTIKIQLFKIVDDEIVFHEDKNVDNTFVFPDEEEDSDFSMVNFIVLKSSLNFGFLSYRLLSSGGKYTIFNQPECRNYLISDNTQDLFQNKAIQLDFIDVIKNDNYAGGKLEIIEQGEGMEVSVLSSGTEIEFTSKDYITGELSFTFRVINTFYKSEICTAKIKVNECFPHCETCSVTSEEFYFQECENGCKPGSYPLINFPNNYNKNCCEKDVDCPDYFYLNLNQYEICDIACLACTESTEYNCVTCYNEKELEKYTADELQKLKLLYHLCIIIGKTKNIKDA